MGGVAIARSVRVKTEEELWGEEDVGVAQNHKANWNGSAGQGRFVALVSISSGVLETLKKGDW